MFIVSRVHVLPVIEEDKERISINFHTHMVNKQKREFSFILYKSTK